MAWEYVTEGVLWRLLPTADGIFVLEDRNIEAKTASFAGVEMRTGAVLWRNVTVDEPWWVGIEFVHDGAVLLHGYGTPDLPDHRKIFVLDLRSGALRWQNTELALLFVRGGSIYATKEEFGGRRYLELDARTGEVLGDASADNLDALRASADAPSATGELVVFPQAAADLRVLPDDLRRQVTRMAGRGTPGLVEVLRHGGFEAVAVHAAAGTDPARPLYTQRLSVRRAGRTVYEDAMNTGAAAAAVPDAFFASGDRLYYIKDQRMLRALALHGA